MVRDESPDSPVMNANLPDQEMKTLLHQTKHEGLGARSCVTTATRDQERHAFAAGADYVYPRDGSKD